MSMWAALLLLLWALFWVAQLFLGLVWCYRLGFRAGVDFMNGDRTLPNNIKGWRAWFSPSPTTSNTELPNKDTPSND